MEISIKTDKNIVTHDLKNGPREAQKYLAQNTKNIATAFHPDRNKSNFRFTCDNKYIISFNGFSKSVIFTSRHKWLEGEYYELFFFFLPPFNVLDNNITSFVLNVTKFEHSDMLLYH